MKIAFYGSSLLSSWWNGAATYYRGLLRDLASRGHEITFYEPDAYDRQQHRDMEPQPWAKSVVYPATTEGLRSVVSKAGDADVVVKASGVGVFDEELIDGIFANSSPDALRIFWDVDAAATLDEMRQDEDHPVRRNLKSLDLVLTYGGGPPVVEAHKPIILLRPIRASRPTCPSSETGSPTAKRGSSLSFSPPPKRFRSGNS
jgi:spore maturation protein CgeB